MHRLSTVRDIAQLHFFLTIWTFHSTFSSATSDLLNTFLFPTFLSFGQEVSLALLGQCRFPYPVWTFTHYSTTYFPTLHYIFSYAILGEPSAIWIIPHFLKPFFMIRCCMTILSSCVSILRWLIFSLQKSTAILRIP